MEMPLGDLPTEAGGQKAGEVWDTLAFAEGSKILYIIPTDML